jgi:8-hydroxy-5-deazaflavin:NADPH oxidoreductase
MDVPNASVRRHCFSPARARVAIDAPLGPTSYGRMFPELPSFQADEQFLHALGRAGGICDCGDVDDTPDSLGTAAAGWPIFGQFVTHDVTADRSPGSGAVAARKNEAAACEIVLLAVPWDKVPETLASLPKWKNQILIDGTNPFHGKARSYTPANLGNLSTSQLVAALAPGARVVKALNNMRARALEADPVIGDARRVAFVSGDDAGAKREVKSLLKAFGYSVVDLGNLRDGGLIQQAGGPLAGRDFSERGEYSQ